MLPLADEGRAPTPAIITVVVNKASHQTRYSALNPGYTRSKSHHCPKESDRAVHAKSDYLMVCTPALIFTCHSDSRTMTTFLNNEYDELLCIYI